MSKRMETPFCDRRGTGRMGDVLPSLRLVGDRVKVGEATGIGCSFVRHIDYQFFANNLYVMHGLLIAFLPEQEYNCEYQGGNMKTFQQAAEEYGDGRSAVLAVGAWQVLISLASNRQTILYKELGAILYPDHDIVVLPLRYILDCIRRYCMEYDLPPLTVLVVNQEGVPGEGLANVAPEDRDQLREEVYAEEWFSIVPPTVEEYAELRSR